MLGTVALIPAALLALQWVRTQAAQSGAKSELRTVAKKAKHVRAKRGRTQYARDLVKVRKRARTARSSPSAQSKSRAGSSHAKHHKPDPIADLFDHATPPAKPTHKAKAKPTHKAKAKPTHKAKPRRASTQAPPAPTAPTAQTPEQAAIALYDYVSALKKAGLTKQLGSKGAPNATVQAAQTAMGGLTPDGIYGPATRTRGKQLTGKTFPPR